MVDSLIGHQIIPDSLNWPEKGFLIRGIPGEGFHEDGNAMLVGDQGYDELVEIVSVIFGVATDNLN